MSWVLVNMAGFGKVELNKLGKVTLYSLFPRAVVVVGGIHAGLSAVAKRSA
jgi:hypothetical protein